MATKWIEAMCCAGPTGSSAVATSQDYHGMDSTVHSRQTLSCVVNHNVIGRQDQRGVPYSVTIAPETTLQDLVRLMTTRQISGSRSSPRRSSTGPRSLPEGFAALWRRVTLMTPGPARTSGRGVLRR